MSFQVAASIVQVMERQAKHLSVLIVGSHTSVCLGLEALLDTSPLVGEVQVASYSTVQSILEGGTVPDVVLADVAAEGNDHHSIVLALREFAPQSHIIVLTLECFISSEEQGLRVLLKSAGTEDLMWVLQKVVTENTLT